MKQAQDSHSNTHVKIEVSMMVSLQCTDTMQIMWKSLWLQLSITAYRHCLIMATICIQPTVKPHPNIYNPLKLEEPPMHVCLWSNPTNQLSLDGLVRPWRLKFMQSLNQSHGKTQQMLVPCPWNNQPTTTDVECEHYCDL